MEQGTGASGGTSTQADRFSALRLERDEFTVHADGTISLREGVEAERADFINNWYVLARSGSTGLHAPSPCAKVSRRNAPISADLRGTK